MPAPGRDHPQFEVEDVGDVTVVRFAGPVLLDEPNVQSVGPQLFKLVDEGKKHQLLLDFSSVTFMSSTALGNLLQLNKKLQAVGGRLALCCLGPRVLEVLKITELVTFFKIYQSDKTGLESFRQA